MFWSASGTQGGVFERKGTKLVPVLGELNCFALTATDEVLFAATEDGLLRYDGKTVKQLKTKYDSGKSVCAVKPSKSRK